MTTAKKSKSKPEPKIREIVSFDFAMKNILRDKANAGILEGFLSELLGRKVKVLAILESEGNIDNRDDKVNRVDIKAMIDGGEIAIFEIQYGDLYDFIGKALFNVSRAIVEQIKSGGFYDVKKVYMICIANFDMGAKREYLFNAKMGGFKGVHYKETIPFAQARGGARRPDKPAVDIHPEYYLILPSKFDDEIRGNFDEWVYALKNHAVKSDFKAAGIKKAAEKMDRLQMTPAERSAYDRHMQNKASLDSAILTARWDGEAIGEARGRAEGEARGKAEGEAIGEARGEARGRVEGKAEGKAEIAKAMKAKGMDVKTISEITALSAGEIDRL